MKPHLSKSDISSSAALASKRRGRICPLTQIDITHQRADCRLATTRTLHNLSQVNPKQFNALVDKFLTPQRDQESTYAKSAAICSRIRKLIKRIGSVDR
ncbi:hypothetical protein [Spirosoma foliorum]|uniref:Uncharacterized protein n=1 Tax=Spirosoma foliorum TaxID=2710596 RepID=A0A7G5GUG3_9BACT|nr:hypothetical protein [Spirosoma foliorum]QMW02505.1 hypothetical protein H3H32_32125 [Spirosoma foliorum]